MKSIRVKIIRGGLFEFHPGDQVIRINLKFVSVWKLWLAKFRLFTTGFCIVNDRVPIKSDRRDEVS